MPQGSDRIRIRWPRSASSRRSAVSWCNVSPSASWQDRGAPRTGEVIVTSPEAFTVWTSKSVERYTGLGAVEHTTSELTRTCLLIGREARQSTR
jgi:hypothetical protein